MGERARRVGYRFGYFVVGPILTAAVLTGVVLAVFWLAGGL